MSRKAEDFDRLEEINTKLVIALEGLMPWMGKALADDAFAKCTLPLAANRATKRATDTIKEAKEQWIANI